MKKEDKKRLERMRLTPDIGPDGQPRQMDPNFFIVLVDDSSATASFFPVL